MPSAIVQSLNSLALSIVDDDPARARVLLLESIERGSAPGAELAPAYLTGSLVAGRLRDWPLTLALTARSMYLYRWTITPLQAATCLAECARAFADDSPEIAGVLTGAAYAAFRLASPQQDLHRRPAPVGPGVNFVLSALHETGELVAAALGDQRRRELRSIGAAMSMDEASSYALANIDPRPPTRTNIVA
jgi:hypothetical protein